MGKASGAVSYTHLDVYKRQAGDREFLQAMQETCLPEKAEDSNEEIEKDV